MKFVDLSPEEQLIELERIAKDKARMDRFIINRSQSSAEKYVRTADISTETITLEELAEVVQNLIEEIRGDHKEPTL